MRPTAALGLVLAATAPAQLDLRPVLPLLDDLDRDAAREVAARYLVAVPESPAAMLRSRANSGGWRRRALLLRVLAERGELAVSDLGSSLESPQWTLRATAARALGWMPSLHVAVSRLEALLDDEWISVRDAALVALHRRAALSAGQLGHALAHPQLRGRAVALFAADPARYASQLGRILAVPVLRARVMRRLAGRELGPKIERALREFAASDARAAARCFACVVLPRRAWPPAPVRLVLAALDERGPDREGVDRLAGLLEPRACTAFLTGLYDEKSTERIRERLRYAQRAPRGSGAALLKDYARCPRALQSEVLRRLAALETPGLVDAAVARFARTAPATDVVTWVEQVGQSVIAARGTTPLTRLLANGGATAAAAFRVLVAAKCTERPVLDYVLAEPRRVVERAGRLLSLTGRVPASFWLRLLRHDRPRVRWIAAKALAATARAPATHAALLAALYAEPDRAARGAMLTALLRGIDADAIGGVVAWILARKSTVLERSFLEVLEVSKRPWVDAALRALDRSRLAKDAITIRAMRGDRVACRRILDGLDTVSTAKLRRMRKPLAHALTARDLPLLARRLLPHKDDEDLPWLREEILAWLRLRKDLDALPLLAELWRAKADDEVHNLCAAALTERGYTKHLATITDRFARGTADEGAILEVLSALPARLGDEQARFLVDLLIAPVLRDPLGGVEAELRQPSYRGRIEVLFPLLRPTVAALGRLEPSRFRRILIRELRQPGLRRAWTSASKAYLLRGLQDAVREPSSEAVLVPVLDWALRLGPRGHETEGALLCLAARRKTRDGDPEAAAALLRRAREALLLAKIPDRGVELIARDLVPESAGPAWPVIEAQTCLLEAAARAAAGEPDRSRAWAERAVFAAREDVVMGERAELLLRRLDDMGSRRGRRKR